MSQQSKDRAEVVVTEIALIKRQINNLNDYVKVNVKDQELMGKITSLSNQAGDVATFVNEKLGKKTG